MVVVILLVEIPNYRNQQFYHLYSTGIKVIYRPMMKLRMAFMPTVMPMMIVSHKNMWVTKRVVRSAIRAIPLNCVPA